MKSERVWEEKRCYELCREGVVRKGKEKWEG